VPSVNWATRSLRVKHCYDVDHAPRVEVSTEHSAVSADHSDAMIPGKGFRYNAASPTDALKKAGVTLPTAFVVLKSECLVFLPAAH
jgi:hypothetical protein